MSPILFPLFLNDLVHFMSNLFNGLSTLTEDVASILNTENIEDLQTALDTMQLYCNTLKLQVNTLKTKIVVFSKGKIRQKPVFFYHNGESLEIVEGFSYFGY